MGRHGLAQVYRAILKGGEGARERRLNHSVGQLTAPRSAWAPHVPGFSEPRVLAHQFLAQRRHTPSAFLAFGMATPVPLVEEGNSGFHGIFEIVAADEAGVVG